MKCKGMVVTANVESSFLLLLLLLLLLLRIPLSYFQFSVSQGNSSFNTNYKFKARMVNNSKQGKKNEVQERREDERGKRREELYKGRAFQVVMLIAVANYNPIDLVLAVSYMTFCQQPSPHAMHHPLCHCKKGSEVFTNSIHKFKFLYSQIPKVKRQGLVYKNTSHASLCT